LVLILIIVSAIGIAGSRSFVLAQQALPGMAQTAAGQMLDQMAAESGASGVGMTGTVVAVSGAVKVRRVKALFWENAKATQEIAEGDHIKTGRDGQAKIEFDDGNFLYIKKNSVVIVEVLDRDASTGKYDAVFKATKARLKVQIDNRENLNNFEIRTPVVVCGVRGTIVYLNCRPGFADVFVERGSAFLRSPVSGQERELPPGMATNANKAGEIAEPEPLAPAQLAEMQGGWEPAAPADEGGAEEPAGEPIILAEVAEEGTTEGSAEGVDERSETQESSKTDYIDNPPAVDGDNDADDIADSLDPDDDNDYLSDVDEATYGTDPLVKDTDSDGMTDWEEVRMHFSDPLIIDTDSDPSTVTDLDDMDPNDNAINELRVDMRDARYTRMDTHFTSASTGLRAEIYGMLQDANERQRDYIMDRVSDAQRHKVMLDSSGVWIRLEQHIVRPEPNKVVVSALTLRTSAMLSIMHWETTFNQSLDSLTSQQLKALPWDAFLHSPPDYGLTAPAVYPTEMVIGFEWDGSPNMLEARRTFNAPAFSTTWQQTVADAASFDSGPFLAGTYTFTSFGDSTAPVPAVFQWSESVGPSTFGVEVHIIDDSGTPTGGINISFINLYDVLGVNQPGFMNIGSNTIEMNVYFNGNTWEYLYLPMDSLMWRGTPEWEKELTW